MIVTIGNTKGGVGKTTVAVNLATARALDELEVWLIDGDQQGTARTAMDIRSQAGHMRLVSCQSCRDGSSLRSHILDRACRYDDVVIDTGARDTTALRAALMVSDVLLVPFQPHGFDQWALKDMAVLVDEIQSMRDGLRCFAFLNCADPGGHSCDNSHAAKAVAQVPQFDYLPTPLVRRKAFANAAGAGQCVFEFKPIDDKACSELKQLIKVLFNY